MAKPTVKTTLRLNDVTGFYPAEFEKRMLVWHHTVGGSADSTYRWWHQDPKRVATSYLVDRNGDALEVFDPKYWAYHLGLKFRWRADDKYPGKNLRLDAVSIGIEIASEGALRSGDELREMALNHGSDMHFDPNYLYAYDIDWIGETPLRRAKRLYHIVDESDAFYDHGEKYRTYQFFDRYDPPQYETLIQLSVWLLDEFGIQFRTPRDHTVYSKTNADFLGLIAHVHVRTDKTDLHPGFDWDRVIRTMGLEEV